MTSPRKLISLRFISACLILLGLQMRQVCADTTVVGWGGYVSVPSAATNAIIVQGTLGGENAVIRKDHSVVVFAGGNSEILTTNPPALSFIQAYDAGWIEITTNHTVVGARTVPPGLTNMVSISSSWYGIYLALKEDGTVVSWSQSTAPNLLPVPAGLSNVVAVSASDFNELALENDGTVVGWPSSFGQTNATLLTNVPAGMTNVVGIATGDDFNVSLLRDGTVQIWGVNSNYPNSSFTTQVPPGLSKVIAISANNQDVIALKGDGTVVVWGLNAEGTTNVPSGLTNVTQIAAGDGMLALVDSQFPPRVTATGASISNHIFSVNIPSLCGHVYDLEYTTNLKVHNWNWLPLVAGNGETLTLTDTNLTDQQRFYRVRRW